MEIDIKLAEKLELPGASPEEVKKIVPPGTILLAYRGSISHGMYTPPSDPDSIDDKDILGVCVATERDYFGLGNFEQREVFLGCWDSVIYEARKFVRLLMQANPNVLSLLWNEPRHFLVAEQEGLDLLAARQMFVSRKAYHAFTGYAYSQLKKMQNGACQGYMGDKRKKLVDKFGYDTKNAAHLIRLLRMGIEFLRDGRLYVDRGLVGDAPQLLSIKRGEWPLGQVKGEADALFARAATAYDECKLPAGPDRDGIERLLVSIVSRRLAKARACTT